MVSLVSPVESCRSREQATSPPDTGVSFPPFHLRGGTPPLPSVPGCKDRLGVCVRDARRSGRDSAPSLTGGFTPATRGRKVNPGICRAEDSLIEELGQNMEDYSSILVEIDTEYPGE
jgi:hypothetical protein